MDFVDDVDLELGPHGANADIGAKGADVIDAAVGGAVDFEDIDVITGRDTLADFAFVAGNAVDDIWAIECFGEDAGGGSFADTAGAGEHVGVCHAAGADGISEGAGDMFLADDFVEGLRSEAAGEYGVMGTRCGHTMLRWLLSVASWLDPLWRVAGRLEAL